MFVFFEGPGEKLFGRVLSKNIYSTMHINIFNFSKLFIQPCILIFSTFQNYLFHIFYVCFFEGPGEKLFMKDYEQWFMRDYEQWFWYNPVR